MAIHGEVLKFDCGPHQLFAIIERGGQNLSMFDDKVFVKWQLAVPANAEGAIHDDLRFGHRVPLCGENLSWQWGERAVGRLCEHAGDCRYRGGTRTAETWAAAFADAEKYVTEDVAKLQAAWDAREQALRDAEAPTPAVCSGTDNMAMIYVEREFAEMLRKFGFRTVVVGDMTSRIIIP